VCKRGSRDRRVSGICVVSVPTPRTRPKMVTKAAAVLACLLGAAAAAEPYQETPALFLM